MRKILISVLLASAAATPALANPSDWSNHHQARENRQQVQQDNRQSRGDARAAERPNFVPQGRQYQPQPQFQPRGQFQGREEMQARQQQFEQQARQQQFEQQARQRQFNADNAERYGRANRGNFGYQGGNYYAPRDRVVPQYAQPQRDWRSQQRMDGRELRQSNRPVPNVMRSRNPLVVSEVPRPGTQPPMRVDGRRPDVQWNTGWRNNDRYDWRDYREHHRSRFHLGFYYDPYGWGYQPFQIGWRLWPAYYQSQFWISDPAMYDLPFAPPGCVWVRYWNDALLVDTWSGAVVDVIPGFFW